MEQTAYAKAWLGLGGNQGAVARHFRYALQRLQEEGCRIKAISALYQTPAWGRQSQPDFFNACIMLETLLPPRSLLHLCLRIEKERGRERREKWGPRSLDLDILFYENYQSEPQDKELILPHPYSAERAFVLVPLCEISPELMVQGKTAAERAELLQKNGAAEGIKHRQSASLWAKGLCALR